MPKNKASPRWTPEEDVILKHYYRSKGLVYCVQRIPNHSQAAIIVHAGLLGLSKKRPKPRSQWTEDEESILLKHYVNGGTTACMEFLPGRTRNAIAHRARKLGLQTKVGWTEKEREILRQYYPDEGRNCSKRLPDKSESSVYDQAAKMGLVQKSMAPWTPKEDAIIRRNYKNVGECKRQLPHRSISSIAKRISALGLGKKLRASSKSWTKEEDAILREYYLKEGNMVIMRLPGRSPHAVWVRADKLGLTDRYQEN